MIRCVAFDFDGTLVDSNQIKYEMFFDVISGSKGGVETLTTILLSEPGDRFNVFSRFTELMPEALISDTPWQRELRVMALVAEYTRRCEDAVTMCLEFPGAGNLLVQLRQKGLITSIVSATPTETLKVIIAKRGWGEMFHHVFGAPSTKYENLRRLATATNLRPDEIVMVGDKQADRQAADDFKCRFIAVARPDNNFTTVPSCTITHLRQLLEILGQLTDSST